MVVTLLLLLLLLENHHEKTFDLREEIQKALSQHCQPQPQQELPAHSDARRHSALSPGHGLLPPPDRLAVQRCQPSLR